VAADIIVSPHGTRSVADYDDTLGADLPEEVVANTGDRVGASGTYPTPEIEGLKFLPKYVGIRVVTPRQSFEAQ
jgi:hypothetical protein